LPVLHVLGIEPFAAGQQRRRDDQGIPMGKPVAPRQPDCFPNGVRVDRDHFAQI